MKKRKAAAAAAVTAAAVAGMVTNAAFETPAELIPEIVAAEEQQEEDTVSASEERQKGPMAKVRNWMLGLPAAVRMLVAVPLWCVGWILLSALSVFWGSAAPWLARLLNWSCLALVLMGVFACSVKAAFPAVSFRRLLRPKNALFLAAASAVLCVADLALPAVWSGYDAISRTVWRIGAACLLAFLCCAELKRQGKREAKRQMAVQPSERTAVELEAMRLADSVCSK